MAVVAMAGVVDGPEIEGVFAGMVSPNNTVGRAFRTTISQAHDYV